MKRKLAVLYSALATVVITIPGAAFAQTLFQRPEVTPPPIPLPNLSNLFPDAVNLPDAIFQFIVEILLIVGGIGAFFYILYGGFLYIMADSNTGQTDQAKKSISGAIIGLIIMALAYLVVLYVRNAIVSALGGK